MIKKYGIAMMFTLTLLSGCGNSDVPPECIEMFEKMTDQMADQMSALGGDAAKGMDSDKMLKELEAKWAEMPSVEQDAMEAMCKATLTKM